MTTFEMDKKFEITQYNARTLLVKDFTLKKRNQDRVSNTEESQFVKVVIGGQAFQMKFTTTPNFNEDELRFKTEFDKSSPSIAHEMEPMRKNKFPRPRVLSDANEWSHAYTISSLLNDDDAMFEDDSNRYLVKFAKLARLVIPSINLNMNKRMCDLNYYLSNEHLLDFSIIVNNQEIKASKFVLTMKSKVFLTMFGGNNWKDVREGRMEVKDIEYDTMFAFVKLLHGFELKLNDPVEALKLRIASDKYEVNDLAELCDNFVIDNLNEKNAIETLIYANQFDLPDVKKSAIDLLTSSSIKFSQLPNVNNLHRDLYLEIIDAFQSKQKEYAK